MKQLKNLLCLLALAAFAGCATHSVVEVKDAVGPSLRPPRVTLNSGNGQLMVYSSFEVVSAYDSDYPTHASYEIYNAKGKLIQRVDNRSGAFYQVPASISLPPGEYTVKAPATNRGMIKVAVMIQENETTTLDLEGSHFRQKKPTGAGQWVRLPSGEVIGMRAP